MKESDIYSELSSIRTLMERSTKFISLSGLSGVMAGIYALIGGYLTYWIICSQYNSLVISDSYQSNPVIYQQITLIAVVVLVLSILTCVWLTIRQANKKEEKYWNPVSRRLVSNMAIPLGTGGLFIIILLLRANYDMIASACLVFYGLSLVSASQYTFSDIKWLGFCQVILGLLALIMPASGLWLWMIGFGLLHIIYGSVMHFKYNR